MSGEDFAHLFEDLIFLFCKTSYPELGYYGIRILATKGFKGGVKYDKKTGETSYEFKGWGNATNNFNGGGVRNYQNDVETMVRESKPRKR